METTTYIALSRQTALRREMELVANNLANMNTTGYQGEHPLFTQYLVPTRDTETRLPDKLAFTHDLGSYRNLSAGPQAHTGNPLDLAIEGRAYFEVEDATGPLYTRAGRFTLAPDGMVTTAEGLPLMTEDGTPLIIAPNESQIAIAEDGTVSTETGQVGKIRLVSFDNERSLQRVAGGLFDAFDEEPQPAEDARLHQGMLEGSNVNPMLEITRMIEVHRAYEATNVVLERENERQLSAYKTLSGAG